MCTHPTIQGVGQGVAITPSGALRRVCAAHESFHAAIIKISETVGYTATIHHILVFMFKPSNSPGAGSWMDMHELLGQLGCHFNVWDARQNRTAAP